MPYSKRLLLALDESEASDRAVAYVADVLAGVPGFHVGLLHVELPPRMLEWGGTENPGLEERVSSARAETYRQIEKTAVAEGKVILLRFQAMLADRGIDATVVLVQFEEPLNAKNVADSMLKTAEERGYGTIVVGRHMFSFWESVFKHHVGEELVRAVDGIAIWVVG